MHKLKYSYLCHVTSCKVKLQLCSIPSEYTYKIHLHTVTIKEDIKKKNDFLSIQFKY